MIPKKLQKIIFYWVLLLIYFLCSPEQAESGLYQPGQVNNFVLAETVFAHSGLETAEIKLEVWGKINSNNSLELKELDEFCEKGAWRGSVADNMIRVQFKTSDIRCATAAYNKLTRLWEKAGGQEPVAVTFQGSITGELSCLEQRETAQSLAKYVRAVFVEGVCESNMNSSSFYTGLAEKNLLVNGKRIDLHIASRYDKMGHTTAFYVASPLIYQDY